MADIFNEIDEELRQEKLKKLWDRWGVLVLVAAVAVVVAVAGWRVWDHMAAQRAAAEGDAFVAATALAKAGDAKGAEAALLSLAKTSTGGYPVLAALRAAGARSQAGENEQALAALDAIAADSKNPAHIAEIARIRAAYLAVDLEDRAKVEARVGDMAAAGRPWRAAAREILALAAWKAGDVAAVTARIAEIEADPETPRDLIDRISVLSALVKAQGTSGKAN